jgi:hypothetical protein
MKLKNVIPTINEMQLKENIEVQFWSDGEAYWGNARFPDLERFAELEIEHFGSQMEKNALSIYISRDEVEHLKELKRGTDILTVKDVIEHEDPFIDELTDIELHDGMHVFANCTLYNINKYFDEKIIEWSFDDWENILSIEVER